MCNNDDLISIKLMFTDVLTILERRVDQPTIVVNREGDVVYGNQAFAETSGYAAKELSGLPLTQLTHASGRLMKRFSTCAGDMTQRFCDVLSLRMKDGEHMVCECSFILLHIAQKQQSGYGVLSIHESKRKDNLLQQFAGSFMRDVNQGVILVDAQYNLVDISDMACKILGLKREDILDQPMEKVFQYVPIEHRLVQRTILDGFVIRNHAVSWTNNQERYELLLDSNVLKNEANEVVGAYITFKDVSNLRSLEQQVRRSDRLAMIGQIAAGTAHEIRNPLTSIKGFLQVLNTTFQQKDMNKEQQFAEIMLSEIDRINSLLSEFLLLSKRRDVVLADVNISTILEEMIPFIHNEAVLYNVSVEHVKYPKPLPQVIGDAEMLKQVFLNICKNGIESMSEGGVLKVEEYLDEAEQRVNVDIHDTGSGIPHFVVDKIFDPFFTTKEKGTGLGLSVCQRIIHDIGGHIRVASKGYGTTFTVSLPY